MGKGRIGRLQSINARGGTLLRTGCSGMTVVNLVVPVTGVMLIGWLAGYFNYVSRDISEGLIHFAYNIAMPALLFETLAQENLESLLAWRFLLAFGGGSLICFVIVFLFTAGGTNRGVGSRTMYGLSASMTNTAFVALPILHRLYGPPGVLPAAIATMFVALVMFPMAAILLEWQGQDVRSRSWQLARHVVLNPLVLSTVLGTAWAITGAPVPKLAENSLKIFGDALAASALFAIGLGLSFDGLRSNFRPSMLLAVIKLVIMPALVWGLALLLGVDQRFTTAAVVCAAVPTAKTVYILSSEHHSEEPLVASTISLTTLLSTVSLVFWLSVLPELN
jgi:malonate transporter